MNKLNLNFDSSKVDTDNTKPIYTDLWRSKFLCTPGCAHTGSFNSFCC